MMKIGMKTEELRSIVSLSDSGTWGEESANGEGSPVLRSTNIANGQMNLADPAWRIIPENDRERRRLASGDIIVTKSSGSPDHIGKCAVFEDPNDGHEYYFSNFMLRLRADERNLHGRWLYYWLTSDRGRFELQKFNSTTTGLRNLSVPQYLSQQIPLPALPEQRRIADILDKADAIRRKRREVISEIDLFLDAAFTSKFGDVAAELSPFNFAPLGDYVNTANGRSSKHVVTDINTGIPIYGGNGINGFAKESLYDERVIVVGRVGQLCGATQITEGPAWITDNAIAVQLKANAKCNLDYLCAALRRSRLGHDVRYIDLPYINQQMIKRLAIPLPPLEIQNAFVEHQSRVQSISRRASESLADSHALFQGLAQRAFAGKL